jgi:hypothetical protein
MVEHPAVNRRVAGSSPARGARLLTGVSPRSQSSLPVRSPWASGWGTTGCQSLAPLPVAPRRRRGCRCGVRSTLLVAQGRGQEHPPAHGIREVGKRRHVQISPRPTIDVGRAPPPAGKWIPRSPARAKGKKSCCGPGLLRFLRQSSSCCGSNRSGKKGS